MPAKPKSTAAEDEVEGVQASHLRREEVLACHIYHPPASYGRQQALFSPTMPWQLQASSTLPIRKAECQHMMLLLGERHCSTRGLHIQG